VAGDVLQSSSSDGQNYRSWLKKLFNKVVTENVLKWPPFESWGRAQADYMLPWFAANGFAMVRGHNVIWPSAQYLPADVQNMLKTNPPDANALRARRRTPLRRATLMRGLAIYQERFGLPNGRVPATFEIITLTAWAPHENQQQPLQPGTAKMRLADALGTVDRPAGDTAAPLPRRR